MGGGFLVGFLIGWFQPMISGQPAPDAWPRFILAAQTGAVFVMMAIFVLNYLEIRRRAYARFMGDSAKKKDQNPKSS